MFDRLRGWVQRNMPNHDTFERNRFLRPIAHRILRPELWRFHRRSVPRGVALGVLVGILIPVAQTIFAAVLALPARANVPVAAVTTFLTNPITTPPIWVAAYWIGRWMLRLDAKTPGQPIATHIQSEAGGWLRWLLADAAPATAVGLVAIAVVGAIIGYCLAAIWWRLWIARKWAHRSVVRARRG
ncbi:MAG: hypothetical protein JWM38_1122 [Sphingomonas bacterium]|jgi:uncharacterized protein (DUF2062 family)|nr:hypothetical protein [Sphingomonas bacterium]MDB5684501.1 hypothetical protein [Sphingomonas bacterium]MDB5717695.1 hypothetical protein [Sphingomonas bacterium]